MTQQSTATVTATERTPNRWLILAGGLLVQLVLGAVYAWSTFSKALHAAPAFELSHVQAAIPFECAIGMIFIGASIGGKIQDKSGPRVVGLVGIVLYALGTIIASFARDVGDLWLLVVGYGIIGGFGLGLAYIVPIALLQKWFPDKRGLITGIAVGGFGFGAVIVSPVAQALIAGNPDFEATPTKVFLFLGIGYLIVGLLGASTFVNPPAGYTVAGATTKNAPVKAGPARDYTQGEALRTPQWYLLTAILMIAVIGGISLVSQAASTASGVSGMSGAQAAMLVGIMGLFNGGGRMLWAALSDKIGRMPSFIGILVILGVSLLALPHATSPVLFYILAALIYLCYGGAFGTMPSTAGDFFGLKNAGSIYGLMLIAWSLGGVIGPLLSSALIGTTPEGNYALAYSTVGIIALVGAVLPFLTKNPQRKLQRKP